MLDGSNYDLTSIITPIDANILEQLLIEAEYDHMKTTYLIEGFKQGFSIKYGGPRGRRDYSRNHKLRSGTKTTLWNKLMKEVRLKRTVGPFTEIPYEEWVQSPITLIPKGSGTDSRLVFDLSHKFENGPLINATVPESRKTVQYQDLQHAIRMILEEEDGINQIYLGKLDASAAFRNIPLSPSESKWLVMKASHPVTGKTYYFADRTLSFGHCLSCRIYQEFALAVAHIFTIEQAVG